MAIYRCACSLSVSGRSIHDTSAHSLYIFDRHCICVYYQDWQRTHAARLGPTVLPGVMRTTLPPGGAVPPSQRVSQVSGATAATQNGPDEKPSLANSKGLPFDEEAKLVYGVVFSLKNMVKRLSGRDFEAFQTYRTSAYKLHYFETPTHFRFVMLSSPETESLRYVLQRLYTGAFLEYVIRNPLIGLDSASTGRGIDSDAFRSAVDGFVNGLGVN